MAIEAGALIPGRSAVKRALNLVSLALVSPCALTCWLEGRLSGSSQSVFLLWTHLFAMLPGLPGMFLRRAFYRWTLERCDEEAMIGFGALFSRRNTCVDRGAYIGPYAIIGSAWLRENTLIGSRASLLSGGNQHPRLPSGEWGPTDETKLSRIELGPNTWVGEGAIIMANVGQGCMVAAGAVVSTPVTAGVMVGGNPARFVRHLTVPPVENHTDDQTIPAVPRLA
jgi:virginiamycin A acetyltransferase